MLFKLGIPSYLLILMPLAIASGPFFSDLFASLLALIYLIRSYQLKDYEFYKNPVVVVLFIFSGYILIRSLLSDNIRLSLESSLFYFRFIFFSIAIALIIKHNNKILKPFGYSILIVLFIVVLDAYYQLLFGVNIIGLSAYDFEGGLLVSGNYNGQLTGIFGEEKILGSFIARMMPLAFAFVILLNKQIYTISFIILIIAADVVIYLSGERSAFFLLFFSLIIIVCLTKRWKKIRILSFLVSIFLIAFISFNYSSTSERMIFKTIKQLGIYSIDEDEDLTIFNNKEKSNSNEVNECIFIENKSNNHNIDLESENCLSDKVENQEKGRLIIFSKHHENHYFTALNMFKSNPIFGIGPKLFRYKCSDPKYKPFENAKESDICSTHPHNSYIQLLSETGIIGFLLIFPLFILICYKFILQFFYIIFKRKYLISDFQICVLVSLFIFTFPLIPTGSVFNNWLSVIHYMAFGFYLGVKDNYYDK